jgi:hypothetical protein
MNAVPPSTFTDEDARDLLGHDFTEEYWTAPDIAYDFAGGEASFSMSYASYKSVDAFLIAFNTYEKEGNVSTLPYQLFGLHYYTPQGFEVFIGAILAFMMAFDDTFDGTGPGQNGLPDPGNEDYYYVVPFGMSSILPEENYVPVVEPIECEKLGEGHFRFGQRWTNLYAKIIVADNPVAAILSAAFPLITARFSELTVVYDVKIDEDEGTVTAETFYTIGEITKLWIFDPVDIELEEADPHSLDENFGLSVVHYVVPFVNGVAVKEKDDKFDVTGNVTAEMDADVNMRVGDDDERAFTIGHRGKYDLIDEGPGTKIRTDEDAVALTLQARLADSLLVAWQALFSLDVFCTASWAVSENLQDTYTSPRALWNVARLSFFVAPPLWYATSFPGWQGYRIEHDPTYTGYADVNFKPETEEKAPGFSMAVVMVAIAVPTFVYFGSRKRYMS